MEEETIYTALREADLSSVEEGTGTCSVAPSPSSSQVERPGGDGTVVDPTASKSVEKGRLTTSIAKHRIKAGGPRHLRQIASILGHARQRGLVPTNTANIDNQPVTNQLSEKNPLIIEMGAGRGMTGRFHTACPRKKIEICAADQISSLSARRPGVERRRTPPPPCPDGGWCTCPSLNKPARDGRRKQRFTPPVARRLERSASGWTSCTCCAPSAAWRTRTWPGPHRGGGPARPRRRSSLGDRAHRRRRRPCHVLPRPVRLGRVRQKGRSPALVWPRRRRKAARL